MLQEIPGRGVAVLCNTAILVVMVVEGWGSPEAGEHPVGKVVSPYMLVSRQWLSKLSPAAFSPLPRYTARFSYYGFTTWNVLEPPSPP
jgi:hypothetical protein